MLQVLSCFASSSNLVLLSLSHIIPLPSLCLIAALTLLFLHLWIEHAHLEMPSHYLLLAPLLLK